MKILNMESPAVITAVLLATLTLGACSKGDGNDTGAGTDREAVLISTAKAGTRDLPIWLETVGRTHSQSAPTLAAEVAGRITMVSADTGDRIEQGQLLAETDTSTLLLQQQAAQAGIDRLLVHIANGERRVQRFETLSSKNLSSQTQLDDAREQLEAFRADHKAAEAQLAIVNDALAKSRIVAPVPGVIPRRMISTGDFVSRGQPLFEVTQPEFLQAWLPYPESVALQIRIGQPAKIYSPLTPGEPVEGAVTDLQPTVGMGSRAVMAIVDLENPGQLRPGATLTGMVLVETRKSSVMVPNMSIVRRPAGDMVYVIKDNRAEARPVISGHREDAYIEIISGLDGGETVATDGAAFLTDGAAVSVVDSGTQEYLN